MGKPIFDSMATDSLRTKRLTPPDGIVRVVLDTDTYNEIDDQFALAYGFLSHEKIRLEAIYAAPFFNSRSSSPMDGMEKSFEEIMRLLSILNIKDKNFAFHGSRGYLQSSTKPQESEAVDDLISRAMQDESQPVYVVAIGAITNVASAIIKEPRIIKNIVVIWLGGNALYWPTNEDAFNLAQDVLSARIVFDCGVPLIHFPCFPVTSHLQTTLPEMEECVRGKGRVGDYLFSIFKDYAKVDLAYSKVIWDISTVAFLVNSEWTESEIVSSPIITDQKTWSFDRRRHKIRNITYINRDPVFRDLFLKLRRHSE
jgi:inosine-uridine nucleoside N-ribohydrolase